MCKLNSEEITLCINSWRVSSSPEFIKEFSTSLPTDAGNLLRNLLRINFPEIYQEADEAETVRISVNATSPGLNFNPTKKDIEAYFNLTKPESNKNAIH
jgi:hypothetical protein